MSRIFGPKRDEVRWELRKLHNEELNNLYSLTNNVRVIESKRIRWAEHAARLGRGDERLYRVLVGKPERKRPFGRHRNRWEEILRWFFGKSDVGSSTCECSNEPSWNFLTS